MKPKPKAAAASRPALVRVLLVEDHTFIRELMTTLLERETDRYDIVAEAGTAAEALDACGRHKPDLVILDINLGGGRSGTDALEDLRRAHSPARILICSGSCDEREVAAALRTGPDGFVDKNAHRETFLAAVAAVAAGGRYHCPRSTQVSAEMAAGRHGGLDGKATALGTRRDGRRAGDALSVIAGALTAREREVLALIAGGRTSKEAATVLGVSLGTVVSHRANLMRKLDLHNAAEMTRYAIKHGVHPLLPRR